MWVLLTDCVTMRLVVHPLHLQLHVLPCVPSYKLNKFPSHLCNSNRNDLVEDLDQIGQESHFPIYFLIAHMTKYWALDDEPGLLISD